MTDTPLDKTGVTRGALGDVVRDYGPAGLDNPQLLNRLLPDLMAGAGRESSLVLAAASNGVANMIAERVGHGMAPDYAVRDIGAGLAQRHAFDRRACDWIVAQYALALGYPVRLDSPDLADTTQVDPRIPVGGGRAPKRTGLIVTIVAAAVIGVGAGIAVIASSNGNKTGAACLVGSWRSTAVQVDGAEVTSGGVTITYRVGGTGQGSTDLTETINGGTTQLDSTYTFDYAATDTGIKYTNVQGSYTATDSTGPDTESFTSFSDDQYVCRGDALKIDTPADGASQTYARR